MKLSKPVLFLCAIVPAFAVLQQDATVIKRDNSEKLKQNKEKLLEIMKKKKELKKLKISNHSNFRSVNSGPRSGCSCPDDWLGDFECDSDCNNAACDFDHGDCEYESCDDDPYCIPYVCECPSSWYGDGVCDPMCNTYECEYDGYDCENAGTDETCASSCPDYYLGDNYCDSACNQPGCKNDLGDCTSYDMRNFEYLGQGFCRDKDLHKGVYDVVCNDNNPCTFEQCAEKCDLRGKCVGFEFYTDHYETKGTCELHKRELYTTKGSIRVGRSVCYKKAERCFTKISQQGWCRTAGDGTGKFSMPCKKSNGSLCTLEECKSHCEDNADCVGIEYWRSYGTKSGTCEIHEEPLVGVSAKDGIDCYHYDYC